MTERLYYNDSYLREFDARVLECRPLEGKWQVLLDRTAFYPTSGGQPFDTGRLGNANVAEVLEGEGKEVLHILDAPAGEETVRGCIDWARRFDHMQQHTGQHILSAAFVDLLNFPTVSFHLGRETCTIDLAQVPSPEQLQRAETRANEIVFANRQMEVLYGTAQELQKLGIRKGVDREGVLRAISIQDFDRQPCGGTHVSRTGEVGLILLRKIEKQKLSCRIEFVCGARALQIARSDYAALSEAARQLSCATSEVSGGIGRAIEERQAASKWVQGLQQSLAVLEAEELLRNLSQDAPRRVVKIFDDADAAYLRILATRLAAKPRVQAFLASRATGHVVFAQSAGLPGEMNLLLRQATQAAGGKGGGTQDFAQGAVQNIANLESWLQDPSPR